LGRGGTKEGGSRESPRDKYSNPTPPSGRFPDGQEKIRNLKANKKEGTPQLRKNLATVGTLKEKLKMLGGKARHPRKTGGMPVLANFEEPKRKEKMKWKKRKGQEPRKPKKEENASSSALPAGEKPGKKWRKKNREATVKKRRGRSKEDGYLGVLIECRWRRD